MHALALGVVDLGAVGRHLVASTPVEPPGRSLRPGVGRYGRRPWPRCRRRPRRRACHCRSADLTEPHVAQELDAPEHTVALVAGDAQARTSGACRSPPGRRRSPSRRSAARSSTGLSTTISTPMSVTCRMSAGDDLGGQPIGRDGEAQEAAGLRGRLEDLDGVTAEGQLPGGRQAGRVRSPTMATRWPLGGATLTPGPSRVGVMPVVGEPLQTADGQRALELATRAGALAWGVAGATRACPPAASPRGRAGRPSRTWPLRMSET